MSGRFLRILRFVRGPVQHGHEGMETLHVASYHHDRLGVSPDVRSRAIEG